MVLSSTEIKQYRQKGFLVRKRLVSPDALAQVGESYENVEDLDPEKDQPSFYYEPSVTQAGKKLLRRIERVSDHSTLARDLILSSEILSAVGELTGETPILFKDKLNLKLPGGAGFRPHVDGHFYWTDFRGTKRRGWAEYGSYFTTVVLPLDRSRVENGCLEVSPLDEALKIFGRTWEAITSNLKGGGPDVSDEDVSKLSLAPLETEIGDVIFFDWRNPHRSKANLSRVSRRILYATYNRASDGDSRDLYYEEKMKSRGSKGKKAQL